VRGRGNISSDRFLGGAGTLINQGTIAADMANQTLLVDNDTFTNGGTVRATNGATLRFNTPFTQTAGTLDVNASTIASTSALQIQGGQLTGFGTISAAISNNATLRPSLGGTGLNVTGNVSLLSASNLVFQIGGLTAGSQYGRLNVTGNVSLGGNLVVTFVNGFQAANSNSFSVLTSTAPLAGSFANVASNGRLTTSNNNGSFLVNYSGNNIVLSDFSPSATPAPGRASSSASAPGALVTDARTSFADVASVTEIPAAASPNAPRQETPRETHAIATANPAPQPAMHEAAVNVEDSTQLLNLLEQTEPASTGGKASVKAARAARRAQARERLRERRAVITLPVRNGGAPPDQNLEAAPGARHAIDRVRAPSVPVRTAAP
jgi:adhesin HecA-like repeat protein